MIRPQQVAAQVGAAGKDAGRPGGSSVRRDSVILLMADAAVSVSNMHRYVASRGTRLTRFYNQVTLASLLRIARLVECARHDVLPFRTKMGGVLFLLCFTFEETL